MGFTQRVIQEVLKRKTLIFTYKWQWILHLGKQLQSQQQHLKVSQNLLKRILAFKRDLKLFRDEMHAKKKSDYIPVTMDELMARFVTNIERNECKNRFRDDKRVLYSKNLADIPHESIEDSVR
jgi:hypothetical protein